MSNLYLSLIYFLIILYFHLIEENIFYLLILLVHIVENQNIHNFLAYKILIALHIIFCNHLILYLIFFEKILNN